MKKVTLLLFCTLFFVSFTGRLKIGSVESAGRLPSDYESLSRYAESLDGFLLEEGQQLDSLLRIALTDCNIPIAGADSIRKKAALFHHAKKLMDRIVTIDTHCDFPECRYYKSKTEFDFGASRVKARYTLEKMRQGHASAVCMAAWLDPCEGGQLDSANIASAPDSLWRFVDSTDAHFAKYGDKCGIARNYREALKLKKQGKVAIFPALENAHWIGYDLSNLKKLSDKGFVYVTLSHQGDNQVCNSCTDSRDENVGLSPFGREVVREMNRLGMLIDLSHTSIGTQREVLQLSKAPVIYTHSCCAALYDIPRNIDDETLRLLASKGGVVHVLILPSFMAPKKQRNKVGVDDMVRHICHIVDVVGIDHVGVGTDFDGGGRGIGMNGANDSVNLTMKLIEKGFSDKEIEKIWGGNFFRVLKEVQSLKQ